MTIIEINKRLYTVPQTWNELSRRQLVRVMKVLYSDQEDVDSSLLQLLRILTGMSLFRFKLTSVLDLEEFLYLTFFLVNERNLTTQLLPKYNGFYGPEDDFNNITGDEFIFSEEQYFKFAEKKDDNNALNELVAILYRPAKKNYDFDMNRDGDPRLPFNQYVSNFYARKKIKRWPRTLKLAIYHWYEGCREKMINDNPDVFTGGSGEPARYGLISVMRSIAESGIHGDFEKVQKMYVKLWMMELNEKMEEVRRIEKESK